MIDQLMSLYLESPNAILMVIPAIVFGGIFLVPSRVA